MLSLKVRALSLGAFLSLSAGSAQAALLGLTLMNSPDIASGFIDVTYNSGTQQFSALGYALTFDDDGVGPQLPISNGYFEISATIDNSGAFVSGSLLIGGSVLGYGGPNPLTDPLLTGNLTAFGFNPGGGDPLEFIFQVTGGDLAVPYYGGLGASVGVILSFTNFGGSFAANFDNLFAGIPGTGNGVSDTAPPVPAPAGIGAFLVAVGVSRRRRRG